MSASLDDIAFLTRSSNRVQVLEALGEEAHTRAELQKETGIPRATIGRIVTDFEKRGLVTDKRNGRGYAASLFGQFLAKELRPLLDRAEAMRKVDQVSRWLPLDEFDFPVDRLVDVTITMPRHGDPTAPIQRAATMTRSAEHIEFLVDAFVPYIFREIHDRTSRKEQTASGIITTAMFKAIRVDPEMAEMASETLRSEGATLHLYNGSCPYTIAIVDQRAAGILLLDDDDNIRGLIDTEDDAILSWAASIIKKYQEAADPINRDDFTT